MHFSQLTAPEQRVLGCLIEKRWTTPDQYPLSLNALRLACNQSTNRDPVTHYDEHTVREAAQRLSKYGLARLASGHSSRAIKYRHLAEEALGLGREELAILSVLLLRGAQTPGELKGRSERMAHLDSLEEVDLVLDSLAEHGYVRRIDRRPGQKEDRFMHLLGGDGAEGASVSAVPAAPAVPALASPAAGSATPSPAPATPAPATPSPAPATPAPATPSPAPATPAPATPYPAPAVPAPATPVPAAPAPATPAPATPAPASPAADPASAAATGTTTSAPTGDRDGTLERRLAALESEVAELRAELRAELAELRASAGERQTDDVGGAADDHARESHLEAR